MVLIFQIAVGIVLAVLILRFLPELLRVALWLAVVALVCVAGFLAYGWLSTKVSVDGVIAMFVVLLFFVASILLGNRYDKYLGSKTDPVAKFEDKIRSQLREISGRARSRLLWTLRIVRFASMFGAVYGVTMLEGPHNQAGLAGCIVGLLALILSHEGIKELKAVKSSVSS